MKKIEVFGLGTIPKIKQGDNLAEIVYACAEQEIGGLLKNDIVILTSKMPRAGPEELPTLSPAKRPSSSQKKPARTHSGSR
jgi:F420-0:gamma-glutamyl ligase